MTVYKLVSLLNLWPIQRRDVLENVLSKKHGELWKIWVSMGHLFVTLNKGCKLLTFDVKPTAAGLTKDAGDLGCLDLLRLQHPVLDVLFIKAHQLAFIVLENGHIHIWKYDRTHHLWQTYKESDLCNVSQSKVVSVCVSEDVFLWCERRSSTAGVSNFCVCKRSLLVGTGGNVQLGPVVALLHNCPPCTLYIINHTLLLYPRVQTTILTCLRVELNQKTVDLFCGGVRVPYQCQPSWQSLDFSTLMLASLPKLFGVSESNSALVAAIYDSQRSCVMAITENGTINIYSDTNQSPTQTVLEQFSHNTKIKYHVFKDLLISAASHHIRYYNKLTGYLLQQMPCTLPTKLAEPIISHPPLFPIIFDDKNIYFLQRSPQRLSSHEEKVAHAVRELLHPQIHPDCDQRLIEAVCKSYILGEVPCTRRLNDRKQFHHPALVISSLDQLSKENGPDMRHVRQSAIDMYSRQGQRLNTDFSRIVEPYTEEYLTLEKLWKGIVGASPDHVTLPGTPVPSLEADIMRLIQPSLTVTVTKRRALLDDYAYLYPDTVLICLMKLLDVEGDELRDEHLDQWAHILMNERPHSANETLVDFPLFDIICRLIFIVMPKKLLKFVKISQSIHDNRAGVPAFLRRGQTMQFYDQAMACVPSPDMSWNHSEAALATVQLILTLDEGDVASAVSLLLRHHLWQYAVKLLLKHSDDSLRHLELFHIVITSMAQEKVLTRFTDDILKLKPKQLTITSLLSLLTSGVTQGDGARETTLADITYSQSQQISVEQIRPVLLDLAYKFYDG